jgi:large subunit ribosomal protein L30
MAKKDQKTLKITQTRSLIGQKSKNKKTIEALGLKRIRHTVIKNDTPQIRGMIKKVIHMVSVEEVD